MINCRLGIETFNPSGITALALDNNQELLKNNIYVQTCIFPVRYEDFDNECVEKVIRKHIGEADVIMTTSLNGGSEKFDIEGNAIEYRGGFHDNMCIGGQDYAQLKYNLDRFKPNTSNLYKLTTLSQEKIFGSKNLFEIKINNLDVRFDISNLDLKTEGSGGNYLSNEVMFRAIKVRGISQKPVGHFHLANLKTDGKSDITRIKEVLYVVIEVLKRSLK
jgi:hypothetical protein